MDGGPPGSWAGFAALFKLGAPSADVLSKMPMSGWCHRLILAVLLLLGTTGSGRAEQCATCGEKNLETFFWLNSAALPERLAVCPACMQLPTQCSICRLPVKQDCLKLEDGRLLCPLHARDAVVTPRDARAVFQEAKREVIRVLRGCGTTPDRNITLVLVAGVPELETLARSGGADKVRAGLTGLTRTERAAGDYQHTVYLLGGLPRARLMAVSAHEYTHAWINENLPLERNLDSTNLEAFCELAACRVMRDLKDETEKNVILDNAYTGDVLLTFFKAEESYGFYRVVQWVQSGLAPRLDSRNPASLLDLKKEVARLPAWDPTVRTAVPDTLRLKGVSGRAGHWLALINNQTLQAGETGQGARGSSPMSWCAASRSRRRPLSSS